MDTYRGRGRFVTGPRSSAIATFGALSASPATNTALKIRPIMEACSPLLVLPDVPTTMRGLTPLALGVTMPSLSAEDQGGGANPCQRAV
ncbi:hypothetical protein JANAI62_14510 [Jannaschia pagri]|uniref:Uncharacterized protein n=1 Tax=Jannaschia pagri TaxID=2829797 RepID=A0ABQ4NK94_9RHOB|nr:hypothetical protein JANAI61_14540 [Jannaschia sp. AI_61]GIT94828.1 hypothetical protein JANAI62_14510 [Jannaschia sp. AI_62]